MRSIYTKIFLWFWLVAFAAAAAVAVITFASGSQPIGRRLMGTTARIAAHSAVDLYEQGGLPALHRYAEELGQNGAVQMELIDPTGRDLLGAGTPEGAARVLDRVRSEGGMQMALALRWAVACAVPTAHGTYIFVARIYPLRGVEGRLDLVPLLLKIVIALLAAGLLCWLLARHIGRPIRALQLAARQIANGDLGARTLPVIGNRSDELAELARDFDRMAERIQLLIRKQHELLGDISHELRSPLTRINVSLELARRGDSSALERVQRDLDRLDELIGQVLTLTRLQSLEGQRIVAPINVAAMLEAIAEDARFEGRAAGKCVALARPAACWLHGDPSLVRSCVENVVRNAIRHTPPETSIELSLILVERNSMAQIVVRDCGEGVAPEALPRLFEPFYRTSPARDAASGGFGLGLAISQRVAVFYKGSIAARNVAGGGFEVEIRLPVSTVPPA